MSPSRARSSNSHPRRPATLSVAIGTGLSEISDGSTLAERAEDYRTEYPYDNDRLEPVP